MKSHISALLLLLSASAASAEQLPEGFVWLRQVDPTIEQDIRYYGRHNFIGRPIAGYEAPECILTREAAEALAAVQAELVRSGLSLKVYDCYRPQRAVDEFVAWAADGADQATKAEFYPRVDKALFFDLGYVARKSGHTRGSTVDLTIVRLGHAVEPPYRAGEPLSDCALPMAERFPDASLDFGTGFDCMDEKSHHGRTDIPSVAQTNRLMLKDLMERHGFAAYPEEWWHYTLQDEPFPDTYFDFPVVSAQASE
ncbi:MAG TPA: M15 family metallopeptidase [Bauldia sp.]|nr:M15 family metallopeptidase [Bauldia sp.]